MLLLVTIGQTTFLPFIVLPIAMNGLGLPCSCHRCSMGASRCPRRALRDFFSGETETTRLVGISLSNAVIIIPFSLIMRDTRVIPENVPQFLSETRRAIVLYSVMAFAATVFALRASSYRYAGIAAHTP